MNREANLRREADLRIAILQATIERMGGAGILADVTRRIENAANVSGLFPLVALRDDPALDASEKGDQNSLSRRIKRTPEQSAHVELERDRASLRPDLLEPSPQAPQAAQAAQDAPQAATVKP